MVKKKLVVLSGAGISAESGLKTFRDTGGLWENYDIMEVASIEGWHKNPELMTDFYNQRRRQLALVEPNQGHILLAEMESSYDVRIITQNVDNLHERAGSSQVLHLHGELTKARSVQHPEQVIDIGYNDLSIASKGPDGALLRPHIVWFGEPVPLIGEAESWVEQADIFVVVGTSLNVYPAAGLIDVLGRNIPAFLIDPGSVALDIPENFTVIREGAGKGIAKIKGLISAL